MRAPWHLSNALPYRRQAAELLCRFAEGVHVFVDWFRHWLKDVIAEVSMSHAVATQLMGLTSMLANGLAMAANGTVQPADLLALAVLGPILAEAFLTPFSSRTDQTVAHHTGFGSSGG